MRGIESVIIVSLQWGFLHPQNWEWEPSGRLLFPAPDDRSENVERQSGYSCVCFVKYPQFTDNVLLHRRFHLRKVRDNSAAQIFSTL